MNPQSYPAPFPSAHLRASILKILLIVGAVGAGISLLVEALSLAFPLPSDDQELGDHPVGVALTLLMVLIALLEAIIYLATVVFFLIWLYRASDNVKAFHPWRRLNYSPGWAVGSFFIPFVNLVIPYRAVKEVWQKSGLQHEALVSEPNPPARFPVWWLFWLVSSFAGNITMRASFNENVPARTFTMISMVASGVRRGGGLCLFSC